MYGINFGTANNRYGANLVSRKNVLRTDNQAAMTNPNSQSFLSHPEEKLKPTSAVNPGFLGAKGLAFMGLKRFQSGRVLSAVEAARRADASYISKLADAVGVKAENLKSITGVNELKVLLGKMKPENFAPGEDLVNVKNGVFRVNLHSHTANSDGTLTIHQYLDKAVEYADHVFGKDKEAPGLLIGLTNHDTLDDVKEAINLIGNNPEKYKNIKFVPGIEFATKYENPDIFSRPVQLELIGYSINPFDKDLNNFMETRRAKNLEYVKGLFEKVKQVGIDVDFAQAQQQGKHLRYIGSPGLTDEAYKHCLDTLVDKDIFEKLQKSGFEISRGKIEKGYKAAKANGTHKGDFVSYVSNTVMASKKAGDVQQTILDEAVKKYAALKDIFKMHIGQGQLKNLTEQTPTMKEVIDIVKDGMVGISHPAKINMASLKPENVKIEHGLDPYKSGMRVLIRDFSNFGGQATEVNYQYGKDFFTSEDSYKWVENIADCSTQLKLQQAGGIDNHGTTMFARR